MSAAATELVPGRLVALGDSIDLDGVASWAPVIPGRAQANNCYLLSEGDQHLLIDTGLRVHWPTIAAQLAERVEPGTQVKVFMTRPEPDAVGNIEKVREVYRMEDTDIMSGGSDTPFDFFATAGARRDGGDASGSSTPGVLRTTGFDLSPERPVRILVPKLRFLPTYWPYDVATKTLFTGDILTHVDHAAGGTLPVIESVDDLPDREHVARHLFSKFWWLPGATTGEFRADLRGIFEGLQPETVAPGYGGVLRGREVVEAHFALLIEVLEAAERGDFGIPSILTDRTERTERMQPAEHGA